MSDDWPYKTSKAELERRREKYDLKSGVRGRGQYLAARTSCAQGHPLSGENLVIEKRRRPDGSVREVRRCRTCLHARVNSAAARRRGEAPEKPSPSPSPAGRGERQKILVCKKAGHRILKGDLLIINGRPSCPHCL